MRTGREEGEKCMIWLYYQTCFCFIHINHLSLSRMLLYCLENEPMSLYFPLSSTFV